MVETRKRVIKKFNRGKPAGWRNKDFEDLSFEINLVTKLLISTATLKRIFGKNKTHESYSPQEATLEALERYGGVNVQKDQAISPQKRSKLKWVYYSVPAILLIITTFLISKKWNGEEIKAVLELQKIEGTSPTTVYFNYEIPDIKDSIFIDIEISDYEEALDPKNKRVSQIYRYPGLFNAKIKTRRKTISNVVPVYITTNGWQALASYYEQSYDYRYFPIPFDRTIINGVFHANRAFLSSIGMDSTRIAIVRLDNYKKTNANGDSFLLNTRIKSINYWPAIRCYSAFVIVKGETGEVSIKLTNLGCGRWGTSTLSEKRYSGQYTDLSGLSVDMKNWNDVQITNNNKEVTVLVNEKEVFADSYQNSIGEIVGTSLIFHGSGFVDYFSLVDSVNNVVFERDF